MSKKGKTAVKAKPAKFRAEDYERPGLSVDEVDEIKEAFDLFDNDGSGAISVNELTSAMQSLGFDVKHAVVYNMVSDLDADGSGEIEFSEFIDVMTAKLSDKNTKEEIDRVFKLFDKDRNGSIEADDLSRVAKELGVELSEEDCREIVDRADLDGDGVVGLDDFYNVITRKTYDEGGDNKSKPTKVVAKSNNSARKETPKTTQPKSAALVAWEKKASAEIKNTELLALDNKENMLFTLEDYFSMDLKESNKSVADIQAYISGQFKNQDPEVVGKFVEIFKAGYESRNLKTLDACRKESFIYKTSSGKNNGMTMVYKIGIDKSQGDKKQFAMNIGMKFEIWKIDDKVQIIALDDMYD